MIPLTIILGIFGFTCYFVGRLTMALDIKFQQQQQQLSKKANHKK